MSPALPFVSDEFSRDHAYQWAANYWNDDATAETFVAYLAALDDDEQQYISDHGYRAIANQFDAALQTEVRS
jgi:hypothetical protein